MLRSAIVVAVLLTPSMAPAYTAFDVGAAYRDGPQRWSGSELGSSAPLEIRTSVYGFGVLSHFAVGGRVAPRWWLAFEGGTGIFGADSGYSWSGPSAIFLARAGLRVEHTFGRHGFARFGGGYEWMGFAGSGLSVGVRDNVWQSELTHGPFVTGSAGARGRHLGFTGRVDAGRAVSTHTLYWPVTLSLALDVTWP